MRHCMGHTYGSLPFALLSCRPLPGMNMVWNVARMVAYSSTTYGSTSSCKDCLITDYVSQKYFAESVAAPCRYETETAGGRNESKEHLLDERDELWVELRHRHFAGASLRLTQLLDDFRAKNKVASYKGGGGDDGGGLDTRAMAKLVQNLPQYRCAWTGFDKLEGGWGSSLHGRGLSRRGYGRS